jgi:hypothetical protein
VRRSVAAAVGRISIARKLGVSFELHSVAHSALQIQAKLGFRSKKNFSFEELITVADLSELKTEPIKLRLLLKEV